MEPATYARSDYAQPSFWNERFNESRGYFDWYIGFEGLSFYLNRFEAKKSDSILLVGCGNSPLAEELAKAGYVYVVNCDISDVCLAKMKAASARKKLYSDCELIRDSTRCQKFAFPVVFVRLRDRKRNC